jgi:hypothetical protein
VDEVINIHKFSYNGKRKAIMRRTTKKRRLMLDSMILITTKKKMLSKENAKTIELIDT